MLKILLPGVQLAGHDAADALAVAITHAHHWKTERIPNKPFVLRLSKDLHCRNTILRQAQDERLLSRSGSRKSSMKLPLPRKRTKQKLDR
jgi:hypothetical protein